MNRNLTDYPLELNKLLLSIDDEYDVESKILKYHQLLPYVFLTNKKFRNESRGLLINHPMGMGKTILACSIAYYFCQKSDFKKDVIVILSKTLQPNFVNGFKKYMNMIGNENGDEILNEYFSFVTLTAGNMIEQLSKASTKRTRIDIDKKNRKENYDKKFELIKNLNDKLIIIDEAHNLFRMIINNPSGNGRQFYDLVLKSKNLNLIFLTGTPIAKDPFELVPCFNMLAGDETLFNHYNDFYKYFVNWKTMDLKNKDKFQNRIFGLVSYASFQSIKHLFPKEEELIIRKVPMSEDQEFKYHLEREKEKGKDSFGFKPKKSVSLSKPPGFSSSYRINSRQVGNFPLYNKQNEMEKLTDEEFGNLHSPKLDKLIEDIISHTNQNHTGIVYSEFTEYGGLKSIERKLKANGFVKYTSDKSGKKYAIISGDILVEDRDIISQLYNSEQNLYGGVIDVLLISKAGAEGLDLMNGRFCMAFEPHWTWGRLSQFFARLIRFKSHEMRKEDERSVFRYIYVSIHSPTASDEIKNIPTSDEYILKEALKDKIIIDRFNEAIKEVSIECLITGKEEGINCKVCRPTGRKLFIEDIYKDIKTQNPCEPLTEDIIDAKKIEIEDEFGKKEEYYYSKNEKSIYGYDIFKYSELLDSFVEMEVDDEYEKVLKFIQKN